MRLVATVFLLACATAASAAEGPKSLRPGMIYPQARAAAIREGWRPVPMRHDPKAFKAMCRQHPGVCGRFLEVEQCDYLGGCEFAFERGNTGVFLTVSTHSGPALRVRDFDIHGADAQFDGADKIADPRERKRITTRDAGIAQRAQRRANDRLPLCSDLPNPRPTPPQSCWVKPPADYRRPPQP